MKKTVEFYKDKQGRIHEVVVADGVSTHNISTFPLSTSGLNQKQQHRYNLPECVFAFDFARRLDFRVS